MTETTFSTTYTSPRLERPSEAPLGGVCLALARTTGTDPVLWRVLFVVTSFFSGIGAILYILAYFAIPREGEQHAVGERLLRGPDRRVSALQILLLAVVVVSTLIALHDNPGVVIVALAGALGFVWWRRHHADAPSPFASVTSSTVAAPAPPSAATPAATPAAKAAEAGAPGAPPAAAPLPPAPAWAADMPVYAPPPPRTRSVLTTLTLSAAALVVGVLLFLAAAGTADVPTEVVLSGALAVVGLGLVTSAFWGRARGLVPVAVLLALALGGTVAARPALDHGIGEREWVAASGSGDFRLGIGDATLRLTPAAADGSGIDARVTLGHILVLVPAGVHAVVDARVQTGDIQGPGDVDANGRGVHHRFELGPVGAPVVHVDARVGTGMVEVRNA